MTPITNVESLVIISKILCTRLNTRSMLRRMVKKKRKKTGSLPGKNSRKAEADKVVKLVLAIWADSSSDSNESEQQEDVSCWL